MFAVHCFELCLLSESWSAQRGVCFDCAICHVSVASGQDNRKESKHTYNLESVCAVQVR